MRRLICLIALTLSASIAQADDRSDAADAAVERAVDWLAGVVTEESWRDVNVSDGNLGAKRLAVEAMLAYTLLLRPDLMRHEELLGRLDGRVRAAASGRSAATQFVFQNWGAGLSSVYMIEKAFRGEIDRQVLEAVAEGFADRQNAEGGWGHGSDLPVGFYPTTLIVTTYWALFALGGCLQHGVEPDEFVLNDALELLETVQVESGGFPYGGRPYRKGIEAGRTSGVLLALASLGRTSDDAFRRAAAYVLCNLGSIPDGHASPAIHVFTGALALHLLGDAAWSAYSEEVLGRVMSAQQEDGSFDDIVPGSPDSLAMMGDEPTRRAYVTALYVAALSTPRSRTAAALRLEQHISPAPARPARAVTQRERWRVALPGVRRVALDATRVLVLDDDGSLQVLDPDQGTSLHTLAKAVERPVDTRLAIVDDRLLAWTEPAPGVSLPASMREALAEAADETETNHGSDLVCFALEPMGRIWSITLTEPMARFRDGGGFLYHLTRSGRLHLRNLDDGLAAQVLHVPSLLINNDLVLLDHGAFVISDESRLTAFDAEGEAIWKRRNRAARGVVPPAVSSLSRSGKSLFVGGTDGSVTRRGATDGDRLWVHQLRSGVVDLEATGEDSVVVLCHDGQVHALAGSDLLWTYDVGQGLESTGRPSLRRDEDVIWIESPAARRLVALDAVTGEELAEFSTERVQTFAVSNGLLLLADDEGVSCYELCRE